MAVPSSTFVLSMLFTIAICRPVFDHGNHRAHFEHHTHLVHRGVPLPRVAWVVTAHPSALESFNNSYAETVSSLSCYALQHGHSFFYEPLLLQVRNHHVVNLLCQLTVHSTVTFCSKIIAPSIRLVYTVCSSTCPSTSGS